MGYVVAAYGLTVVGIGGYALYLLRERATLRRALERLDESNPG